MTERTCSVDGCARPRSARGWCRMHYQRWRIHGDPLWSGLTDAERFWANVAVTPSCWLWLASTSSNGYGQFYSDGAGVSPHRWVYEHLVGPIPAGLELDHTCHSDDLACPGGYTCVHRRCVNPAHLEPVTHTENVRRGRSPSSLFAAATACHRGHPFDRENTYVLAVTGWRVCRTCQRGNARRFRERKKAASQ